MDARPLLINAHHRAGALLAWSAPAATSPWAARVRDATHAWLRQTARLADPDAAPAPPWQAACDAAAALRDLVAQAPTPLQARAAEHEAALTTWLAQAQAYRAAAEPVPPPTPAASAGPAQDALQQALQAHAHLQPNAAWCFVCGLRNPVGLKLRFLQAAEGRSLAYAVVPEAYQGYPGVVHGGIVAAMLDEITGRAGTGTDPATARLFYTARLSIRYRRHVPTGRLLRLEGELVRDRGRFYEARGAIYDADTGRALATAEALLAEVPRRELQAMNPEAIGWKVYPLEDCHP